MIRTMGVFLKKDRNNDRHLGLISKMVLGILEKLTSEVSIKGHCAYMGSNTLLAKILLFSEREWRYQSQFLLRNTPMFPCKNYNIRTK